MGYVVESPVDEWLYSPDKLELLKCWARDFPLVDIAAKMGITVQTLRKWKKKYPEIAEAINQNKEILDYKIENALVKKALGYTTTDVRTIISPPDKDGNRKIRVEKIEREIPPDTTAIMAWLNNRKPDQWKRNRDNIMQTKDEDSKITVNIIKHGDDTWDASAQKETVKTSSENSNKKQLPDDLDYWPDNWEEE